MTIKSQQTLYFSSCYVTGVVTGVACGGWLISELELWRYLNKGLQGFLHKGSVMGQTVRHLSVMQETRVQSLGWEDPLEKEYATHSCIFGLPLWLSW